MRLIIVGGVAGGASAAARARRLSEEANIIVFERGPDVSFANCGLPYYIGGEIAERDKLIVVTPEMLRERFKLDIRVRTSVETINRAAKTIRARDLASGREYDEPYDKLILAPGASPIRPPVAGVDLPGIFTMRDLRDADRIKEQVDRGIERAIVVGGGYIGLEMVENLVRRGVATTLVESHDQLLATFDREMTTPLVAHLAGHGVEAMLNETASAFTRGPGGLEVRLGSGRSLATQMVILGVGVRPESSLAVASGLTVGRVGGSGSTTISRRTTRTSMPSAMRLKSTISSSAGRARSRWPDRRTARADLPPTTFSDVATPATVELKGQPLSASSTRRPR